MFKLMDKKIIAILRNILFFNWPYGCCDFWQNNVLLLEKIQHQNLQNATKMQRITYLWLVLALRNPK